VEQFGAGSGTEGAEALTEPALELIGTQARGYALGLSPGAMIRFMRMVRFMRRRSPLRVTYDPGADAAYIYLTGRWVSRGRVTVPVPLDDQDLPEIILDFKDGRLVGVEVLGAKDGLPGDLLGLA